MNFSKELQDEIKMSFSNDENLEKKILSGDLKTIREIGKKSRQGLDPKDVLSSSIEELYIKAKKLLKLQELYEKICREYAENLCEKSHKKNISDDKELEDIL